MKHSWLRGAVLAVALVGGAACNKAPTQAPTSVKVTTPTTERQSGSVAAPTTTAVPIVVKAAPSTTSTTVAVAAPTLSNDNSYTNSDGVQVHSPAYSSTGQPPAGATAQCNDGTYSFSLHHSGTCSGHGGVSRWL